MEVQALEGHIEGEYGAGHSRQHQLCLVAIQGICRMKRPVGVDAHHLENVCDRIAMLEGDELNNVDVDGIAAVLVKLYILLCDFEDIGANAQVAAELYLRYCQSMVQLLPAIL